MLVRSILAVALGLALVSAAVAEEEAKTPAAKAPAAKTSSAKTPATKTAAAKTSSAKASSADAAPAADFATLYKGWKQRVARMYQIQQLYKNDASADKEALLAEFNDIMEKAQDELPPVLAAGEKEYLAAPNKNKELNSFLFTNLLGFVQADDFEKAAKLARLLTEHDFEAPQFNLLAGVSFFAVNDYENAEKYLKLANDSQQITRPAQQYLEQIETYKEKWAKEQKLCAVEEKADNLPRVKLETTQGDIVVELFENQAPNTVANFISLVEKKFYDGLSFHRVLAGFMAQTGDPSGDGSGGPGYTIPDECVQENHRDHFRGSLSMGNNGQRDSGGSQFFITFLPTGHLDGKHTVFGRVVEGMDVLAKLRRIQPDRGGQPDKIVHATVLSKRKHPYRPIVRPDKK